MKSLELFIRVYHMQDIHLEKKIDAFCKSVDIKKKDFSMLFGLSGPTRLYEILTNPQDYHINHFALLQELHKITEKTGQEFLEYVRNINKKIRYS